MNTKNLVENCGVRPQENSDGFRPSNTEKREMKKCLNCGIKLPTKSEWKENRDWQIKTGYCTVECKEQHKESKEDSKTLNKEFVLPKVGETRRMQAPCYACKEDKPMNIIGDFLH